MVTCGALWLHCFQGYLLSWDVFWDLTSNLIISGCDSTLTVLGLSAVISSVAHYLGLSILAFIGTTECVCVEQQMCCTNFYNLSYILAIRLLLEFSDLSHFDPSGSTEEEDKRLGFVAPVLFFILALQTGLSSLDPEERLVSHCRICASSSTVHWQIDYWVGCN